MIQAININFNKRSTLQNKGVRHAIAVSNSLMDESKKVEKKIVNYLVVPNNFILSHTHRRYRRNVTPKHSRIRARGAPAQLL